MSTGSSSPTSEPAALVRRLASLGRGERRGGPPPRAHGAAGRWRAFETRFRGQWRALRGDRRARARPGVGRGPAARRRAGPHRDGLCGRAHRTATRVPRSPRREAKNSCFLGAERGSARIRAARAGRVFRPSNFAGRMINRTRVFVLSSALLGSELGRPAWATSSSTCRSV